jgi:hypothetical protein
MNRPMNRPIFLTRTQRVLHATRLLVATIAVFGMFIAVGLLIAYEVSK